MPAADPRGAGDVVGFWRDAGPKRWFRKDEAFDAMFRERFEAWHFAAARRHLDAWAEQAEGALALVILLDQFPRNAFRRTAHMYATDPLARSFALSAIERGFDPQVGETLRLFFYLPFAHSESVDDQEYGVQLHMQLGEALARDAIGHRDIIRRFGRFPHRNVLLGRETTADEQAFLDGGGFAG